MATGYPELTFADLCQRHSDIDEGGRTFFDDLVLTFEFLDGRSGDRCCIGKLRFVGGHCWGLSTADLDFEGYRSGAVFRISDGYTEAGV